VAKSTSGGPSGGGAGIGGGSKGAGGTITINGGIVFAKTSESANLSAAIGGSDGAAAGKITISGGFVVAQSANPAAPDIGAGVGYTGAWDGNTNAVIITGGLVHAGKANIYPEPRNASGITPVFPLYVPGRLGCKAISVPAFYTTKTIGKSAARFLTTGRFTPLDSADPFPTETVTGTDIFPHAVSATLWLPENPAYTGITTTPDSGSYYADVQATLAPYSGGLGSNRLLH
jgi:hypothetical protein